MSADEKNISRIERDLMLGYVRNLYEVFLEEGTAKNTAAVPPPPTPKPIPTPEPIQPYTPPTPPPTPKPVEAPPAPPPPPPAPKPMEQPQPAAIKTGNNELDALFNENMGGKEISDRLGATAIADLAKGFGLNDKLLNVSELFGGNQNHYEEVIKTLNGMSGYEAAQFYLLDIAQRYQWAANPERRNFARNFIRTVRRRYL